MSGVFVLLYSVCYITVNVLICNYFISILMLEEPTSYNSSFLAKFHKNYVSNSPFLFFFFILGGLPPVVFFFIKLAFTIKIAVFINYLVLIIVVANLVCGTIFYLQVFNVLSTKYNGYDVKFIRYLKKHKFLVKTQHDFTESKYINILKSFVLVFLLVMSIWFIADLAKIVTATAYILN